MIVNEQKPIEFINECKCEVGKKQTPEHINKRIDATTQTRYGHSIYEHSYLLDKKAENGRIK